MGPHDIIFVFWMLSFKPTFSLSSFIFIKRLFSSSLLSAIRMVSSEFLRLLIFLLAILIPACASSSPEFLMMYSAYKLKKQGDNIQPWRTPVPIWNPSVVPCPVLTEDITSVSLQWVVIFLLVEGLAWKLLDGDWSGGGCWRLGLVWQFLKTRQWWSLIYWLALPFMNNLSVACSAIWQHFTHSRTSFKIGVSSLKLGLPL